MAEIYQLPDNQGNSGGFNGIPFSIPIGGNGGLFGGNGFGNDIGGLIALAIVASIFGWNNGGGFGGGMFGGGNNAAGFLANQIDNNGGRELIMNAVTSQGEASRSAIQNLATMLGQDFNLVNGAVQNVQNALQTLALQQAVSVPQIINSIQSGNQQLAQQLCQCCCQTQQQIMAQGYENQIRTIEQTGALSNQADRNTAALQSTLAAMQTNITKEFCDIREREMQDKINTQSDIITQLRGQIDNANQTAAITGYVNSLVAPLQRAVDKISANQLPTVNVQWPQLTAVNTTPYVSGGFYGQSPWGWNGFGGNGNIVF